MRYWDIDGKEIQLLEWANLFGDWKYRLVKQDDVVRPSGQVVRVVTVWLGDNAEDLLRDIYCEDKSGYRPRIFGTLIGTEIEDISEIREFRHETLELAKERHEAIVLAVSSGDVAALSQLAAECGV